MTVPGGEVRGHASGYLGWVLDSGSTPVGMCFQVAPGLVVTAWGVAESAAAGREGAVVALGLPHGRRTDGRVVRVDPLRDLVVINVDTPLPASVVGFAAADGLADGTEVRVTGATPTDPAVTGVWAGCVTLDDQVVVGRIVAGVDPSMYGSPVRRTDDMVVGVLSARYTKAGAVLVSRAEDLLPLVDGLVAPPPLVHRTQADHGLAVTLIVDDERVRLRAPGVDVGGPHRGVSHMLARQVNHLWEQRALLAAPRDGSARDLRPAGPPPVAGTVGRLLAETFLPAPLDMALRGLSMDLSGAGRADEALAAAEEAVAVWRGLVSRSPGEHESSLAVALNSLAHRLDELGQHEAALAVQSEARALTSAKAPTE